jgi:hypothetical protein
LAEVVAPHKKALPDVLSAAAVGGARGDGYLPDQAAKGVTAHWRTGPRRKVAFIKYPLLWCPAMPAANFVLARVDASGERRVLRFGRVESDTPIYNLAQLRHAGASLGATEVHVHIPAAGIRARRRIERQMAEALENDTLQCRIG